MDALILIAISGPDHVDILARRKDGHPFVAPMYSPQVINARPTFELPRTELGRPVWVHVRVASAGPYRVVYGDDAQAFTITKGMFGPKFTADNLDRWQVLGHRDFPGFNSLADYLELSHREDVRGQLIPARNVHPLPETIPF